MTQASPAPAPAGGTAGGEVVYVGRDLEAMSFAENYHRWILDVFAPYLGKRVVEVGAGSGSFSELLLERGLDSLAVVEPSCDMYQLLEHQLTRLNGAPIEAFNATFGDVADRLRDSVAPPDSIVYVNVLEHIADDTGELKVVRGTLSPGGRVFIFVPAFRWLYGRFDEQVGHYRRYKRLELARKCEDAGFRVLLSRYFDFPGVLPWWVKYRLLGSAELGAGAVRAYDRWVVPVARRLEARVTPPFGKNVLVVAEVA